MIIGSHCVVCQFEEDPLPSTSKSVVFLTIKDESGDIGWAIVRTCPIVRDSMSVRIRFLPMILDLRAIKLYRFLDITKPDYKTSAEVHEIVFCQASYTTKT